MSSSGRKEKDINLEMALDIKSKLESDGIEVVMTRTSCSKEREKNVIRQKYIYVCHLE